MAGEHVDPIQDPLAQVWLGHSIQGDQRRT
jgi:hypothetical protein